MAGNYTKSKHTDRDIVHITVRSFRDFGEQQTVKYIDGLTERLQWLADSPERGRVFTHRETGHEYLYYPHVSHVIYYRLRKDDIYIVRILHKKMLPEKYL